MRSRYQEGAAFFVRASQQLAPSEDEPTPIWGRILARLGWLQSHFLTASGDIETNIEKGLAIAKQHGEQAEIGICVLALGAYHALVDGNHASAQKFFEQSLDQYRAVDDRYYIARALLRIGYCSAFTTGLPAFHRFTQESLELARETGSKVDVALALTSLSNVAFGLGDHAAAERYCRESLIVADEIGARGWAANAVIQLGLVHFLCGNMDKAAMRAAEGLAIAMDISYPSIKAFALAVLGLCAGVKEDYLLSRQHGEASVTTPSHTVVLVSVNWALTVAPGIIGRLGITCERSSYKPAVSHRWP